MTTIDRPAAGAPALPITDVAACVLAVAVSWHLARATLFAEAGR
ncbi:hypothetical protein [Kineococcus sp. SYSU DK018]